MSRNSSSASQFNVPGAPNHELARSPAAATVGLLAEASNLILAHYEYRHQLEAPEHWVPEGRDDLIQPSYWQAGVLREGKYGSFRNDLMLGSFHPSHRAKWTSHELCHGLVGFAWQPGATTLYHALAARLSELLPVALFYFFDEAYLNRCPDHQGAGPLFATFCRACEEAARKGPRATDSQAERFMKDGQAFVERELAAIVKSRRLGRPINSPWANLDLMSDGLAYAAAQERRLQSPEFERYMYLFFPEGTGKHHSLEELENRVIEVLQGICHGASVQAWNADSSLWKAQDIGWRLLEVSSETDGDACRSLIHMVEQLAASPTQEGIEAVIRDYEGLHQDYMIPDPKDLFATGYIINDTYGLSEAQISEGIASALPETWEQLEDKTVISHQFSCQDIWQREPLAKRFVNWLEDQPYEQRLKDIANFEARVCHLPAPDAATLTLSPVSRAPALWRLAPDVDILPTTPSLLEHLQMPGEDPNALPYLALRRNAQGEVSILRLDANVGLSLSQLKHTAKTENVLDMNENELASLIEHKLLIPESWALEYPNLLND